MTHDPICLRRLNDSAWDRTCVCDVVKESQLRFRDSLIATIESTPSKRFCWDTSKSEWINKHFVLLPALRMTLEDQ
jgi:hypothetical protein